MRLGSEGERDASILGSTLTRILSRCGHHQLWVWLVAPQLRLTMSTPCARCRSPYCALIHPRPAHHQAYSFSTHRADALRRYPSSLGSRLARAALAGPRGASRLSLLTWA